MIYELTIVILVSGSWCSFPSSAKTIESKEYTMKILIREENVKEKSKLYVAKDMEGKYMEGNDSDNEHTNLKPVQESYAEVSTYMF